MRSNLLSLISTSSNIFSIEIDFSLYPLAPIDCNLLSAVIRDSFEISTPIICAVLFLFAYFNNWFPVPQQISRTDVYTILSKSESTGFKPRNWQDDLAEYISKEIKK